MVYFMSQPAIMACVVPLPPSPSADNAAHHGRAFLEKKHPDLFSMCIAALDVEVDLGQSGDTKRPDLINMGSSCLDEVREPKPS